MRPVGRFNYRFVISACRWLFTACCLLPTAYRLATGEPAWASPRKIVHFTKRIGDVPLEVLYIRMKDPTLRIYSVFPRQGAGTVDKFEDLVQGLPPGSAAINGAYFNVENRRIVSNFIESYRLLNQCPNDKPGTTILFTHDHSVLIERGLRISAHYIVNSGFEWWQKPTYNRFHGVNTPIVAPGLKDSLKLFNYYYTEGRVALGTGKAAIIQGGIVTEVETRMAKIPVQGYVIAALGKATEKIDRLRTGDSIQLEYRNARTMEPWKSRIRIALGAGPKLLADGKIDIRAREEGFTDPGVYAATRRLALGLTGNDTMLVVFMLAPIKVHRAAQIMKMLGCQEAVNLDGGASSALYYDGKVRVWPNRLLNNLLVFE